MKLLSLIWIALGLAAPALAQGADGVSAELAVYQVVARPDGGERLVPAERVQPGDVLEYRAVYRNQGKTPARRIQATLPIPREGVVYLPDTAQPAPVFASIDGRRYEPAPLVRWVVKPDGSRERQPVPADDYRSLRWELGELAPGRTATVRARVRIDRAVAITLKEGASQ